MDILFFNSSDYVKGIKNGCLCIVEIRGTQGCAFVGDPARAVGECREVANAQPCVPLISTMHGQPFLIPFITWNVKWLRKKTKYDVNRSGQSRHKSHYQSAQCTRPSHCLRQQWRHNPIQLRDVTIATQWALLRAHVNRTEIIWKSTDRRSNLSLFLYVQGLIHGCLMMFISRVIRWNCFSKMWRISLRRILQNNDLQC